MPLANKTNEQSPEKKVVNAVDDFVDGFLEFVEDIFKAQRISLDDFAFRSSKELDKIILKKMKGGAEFIAGRFSLVYVSVTHFKFSFEFYVKNPNEKDYTKVFGDSRPISTNHLKEDALEELSQKKEIAYEIDEPSFGKFSKLDDNSESKTQGDD